MRSLLVISLMLVLGACTRMSADFHLDNAYRQYAAGDCAAVALELSQAHLKHYDLKMICVINI